MKFFCLCFSMMILILGIWVEVGTAQTPIPITETEMPDANLRAAVLARLKALSIVDSTATSFTDDDMEDSSFTSFSATRRQISDMTGLKYATSLTELNLNDNSISAIPTTLPTSLTALHLNHNSIEVIPNLSSLTKLTELDLHLNSISTIPTDLPTSLTNLRLYNNSITAIPDLSSLINLKDLRLQDNSISAISNLPTSLINLALYNNSISDISALKDLTNLTNLNLGNNNIGDISALSSLTSLTDLFLDGSRISTTDLLLPLTELTILDIAGHRITDVKEFQQLLNLPKLYSFRLDLDPDSAHQIWWDRSILNDIEALRQFLWTGEPDLIDAGRAVSLESPRKNRPSESPRKNRPSEYQCLVGWQRSDPFARKTQRVIIYEVKLEMDMSNRVSIYKPTSVAIYVHPDEALENLEGWKLQVAIPYNHHRNYLLTAENSVVVDSEIEGVEGGFAFIKNPEADPFPMVGMGFTGATVPGFDYRLYDDRGQRVDFGIACYKRGDIFQVLRNMEEPRVFRKVDLETLDWDVPYIRSEWTVPVLVPAAPSLVKKTIVGTWGDLKKQ